MLYQVLLDWVLKLLPINLKTKAKRQKQKKEPQPAKSKHKKNRKTKAWQYVTCHGPVSQEWMDGRDQPS